MPLRLVLIEDQHMFRESVAASLKAHMDVEIIGSFSEARSTLQSPHVFHAADVALVDVRLADTQAFDLVAELGRIAPRLRLIWVTSIEEDYLLHRAFEAHLPGFVHKEDRLDILIAAIRAVADGGTYLSDSVKRLRDGLKAKPNSFHRILSTREQEVLRLIGAGLSNEEASAFLSLSAGTVQAHRRNIMSRLELHTASELQAYAVRHGFTAPESLKLPGPPLR